MIKFRSKGNFSKAKLTLEEMNRAASNMNLDRYGKMGVDALSAATPKDTGKTASSWTYEIVHGSSGAKIEFHNSNTTSYGMPVVFLLTYGHMTKAGYYIEGQDFINPALKPVFDNLANQIEKELR